MEPDTEMTVGEIAGLAGLTVRTLHHYDEIGLVVAAARTAAGYRLYRSSEVERLQEVLFYRELGFALDEIKMIVSKPGYDRVRSLVEQRDLLVGKTDRLLAMVDAVEHAIESERLGLKMSNEEMLEVFGGFDPAKHEEEARQRWGDTDAYRKSARRTASYGKREWEQMGQEAETIDQAFVALMEAETPATSEQAMDLAESHRAHITKWFYDCTPEIHAGLGRMYAADPRFSENIDEKTPGLAGYLSDAIAANARR